MLVDANRVQVYSLFRLGGGGRLGMKPILIAGAGPTGLILAIQLARRGVAFEIISAATGPGTTSRAIVIHARTLELYDQLGFADEILTLGSVARSVRIRHDGHDVATIALGDVGRGLSRFPFVFTLAQDDHERFLICNLRELGVEVRWNCSLATLTQLSDCVSVKLNDGGMERAADYAYVCGCDGARSAVRHAIDVSFPGGTYEGLFYVADVQIAKARQGELVVHLEGGTFALMMPVRQDGGVRLVGIVDKHVEAPSFEQLQPGVERVIGARVEQLNWFSTYRVHHRVASYFRDRRCFLLGDAAHLHSPAGGQGMNTGIGDATNLAWKLAAVVAGEASDALLDSYNHERRPFAETLVATTDRIFESVVDKGVTGRVLRRFLLPRIAPLAMRFGKARAALFRRVSQIAIHYRGSALSEGKAGSVRGGDRFPFVTGGDYESTNTVSLGWTAIVYGQLTADACTALQELGFPLIQRDWTAAADDAGLLQDALYLLRPDTYVGLADAEPTAVGLRDYLGRNCC
jgi:2-polyprenyl-6-methoxyphenol hydroxylase-like FAD-dependent oxidoreductase